MTPAVEAMTAELAAELASAERHRDTRSVRVRNYALKAMAKSPAHCRHALLTEADEPNLTQRLGSGVHSLLLGGPRLVVYRGGKRDKRVKAYQEFVAANDNAIICTASEYETANRTADAVRNDRLAAQVLYAPGTVYEQTIEWDWLGRSRRCTPDARSDSHLVELKTTQNAAMDRFKWDALRYGYIAQLSDYANAIATTRGFAPKTAYIVAVEKKPPYALAVYRVSPRDLDAGLAQCRAWMERLLVCEASGMWPGYSEAIQDLELPSNEGLGLDLDDLVDDNTEGPTP